LGRTARLNRRLGSCTLVSRRRITCFQPVDYLCARNTIDILNRIIDRNLPVDTYVPGHGPVHVGRGIADVVDQRDYFIMMRDEVAKMVMAGKTLEQIQKEFKVPARFAHYAPGRLAGILRVFYYQLIEHGRYRRRRPRRHRRDALSDYSGRIAAPIDTRPTLRTASALAKRTASALAKAPE